MDTAPADPELESSPAAVNVAFSAIVADSSGNILQQEKPNTPINPGSTTKLLTAYVTLKAMQEGKLTLDSHVKISAEDAAFESNTDAFPFVKKDGKKELIVKPGDEVKVDDLLKLAGIYSANGAAKALAHAVGGNETEFTKLMTAIAHKVGMSNSTFFSPNGMPGKNNNVTTAADLAKLALAFQRDFPNEFQQYFGVNDFTYTAPNGDKFPITGHNKAFVGHDGTLGGKTGHTYEAGFNNVVVKKDEAGHILVGVITGAPNTRLRDYLLHQWFHRAEYSPDPSIKDRLFAPHVSSNDDMARNEGEGRGMLKTWTSTNVINGFAVPIPSTKISIQRPDPPRSTSTDKSSPQPL